LETYGKGKKLNLNNEEIFDIVNFSQKTALLEKERLIFLQEY
jgi:hypothetical protein